MCSSFAGAGSAAETIFVCSELLISVPENKSSKTMHKKHQQLLLLTSTNHSKQCTVLLVWTKNCL